MPLVEEKFEQHKIDSLKRYLQKEQAKGRSKDYEIVVDDFKIVSRTNDVSEFDDYEPDINENTRKVSILIFDGAKTNRNTNYTFHMQDDFIKKDKDAEKEHKQAKGLGEIEQIIQDKLDAKDKEYELKRLRELLDERNEKLKEAEDYNEKIEKQVENLLRELDDLKKNKVAGILKTTDIGGKLLQQALSGILKKIPGAEGLGGMLEVKTDLPNAGTLNQPNAEETAASFERAEPENKINEVWADYIKILESKFNEEQRGDIIAIVNHLSDNTRRIETVKTLLKLNND